MIHMSEIFQNCNYFGTNGVRGRLDFFTPVLACRLADAFARYITGKGAGKRIVLGRDHRTTSELISTAVGSGLLANGMQVVDCGLSPSPLIEYFAGKHKFSGGMIVTASHNPPEWNAIKFLEGALPVSKERGIHIEKLMNTQADYANAGSGEYQIYNALPEYLHDAMNALDIGAIRKRKFKVVLDCGNGTGNLIAPLLLRELGAEVVAINSHIDGHFPGRMSEPTQQNIEGCIGVAKAVGADIGIALDGDCDRLALVDENGNYVIGDKVLGLGVGYALASKKRTGGKFAPKVVTTVATSDIIREIAERHGASVVHTKVGAPYIAEAMVETNAISGGEEVGGVIWPSFSLAKDGFFTFAKIMEMLATGDLALSEAVSQLPARYATKLKLNCPPEQKGALIGKLKKYAADSHLKFNDIDGLRIEQKEGWCIVRESGTENLVRIFAESKSKQASEKIASEMKKVVERILG